MPVSAAIAESNRRETDRLRVVLNRLDDASMAMRLPNGWTISGMLAHVAFWDRQRLAIMKRAAAGIAWTGGYDGEVFNEAMQPVLEAIPSDRVKALALQAAAEIDALLEQMSDDVIAAATSRPDAPRLDRGSHRGYHLDQIEAALAGHN